MTSKNPRLPPVGSDLPALSQPLPPPDHSSDRRDSNGHASVSPRRSSALILGLSSVVAAGVQFGWALQLSLLTPYIQTLGIEHAFTSFIWLCGPVTGLVVQPCVGVWSDKCTLRLGRRRPFILGGSLLICLAVRHSCFVVLVVFRGVFWLAHHCAGIYKRVCLSSRNSHCTNQVTIIGFAADIGSLLGDSDTDCKVSQVKRPWAAGVFVMGFWLLDLANNTVQGPARALLADLAGPDQRHTANAIFCLWMAIGNVIGFSAGASDKWHRVFPFVKTQACCEACGNLKAAFLVAVVFLFLCTLVTLLFAKEIPLVPKSRQLEDASPLLPRQPQKSIEMQGVRVLNEMDHLIDGEVNGRVLFLHETELEEAGSTGDGPGAVLVNLLTSVRQLRPEMISVLVVMALCWLSWFPFFLFDTDWMGREVFQGDPLGDPVKAAAYQNGVHKGAFGLLLNSIVLAIGSFLIDPLCRRVGPKFVWSVSNFMIFFCMGSTAFISAVAVQKDKSGHSHGYADWAQILAIAVFAMLGLPLAVTYSVPYSITAELASDSGGGQGLAMGILNLAVVAPQIVVALGAGPWDALFGGGNEPAFAFAALFAFAAGVVAWTKLPQLSKGSYTSAGGGHGFG